MWLKQKKLYYKPKYYAKAIIILLCFTCYKTNSVLHVRWVEEQEGAGITQAPRLEEFPVCSYKIDNEMCTQQEWKNLRFLMRFPHSSLPAGQTQMLYICSRGLFVCVLMCTVKGKKFPDTSVFVSLNMLY